MNKLHKHDPYQHSGLHQRTNLSPIKPREKMPTVYRHRYSLHQEFSDGLRWPKDNGYLNKRINEQVELERSTMIMKSGRMSQDTPNWMTLHSEYYKKDHLRSLTKSLLSQKRQLDVLSSNQSVFQSAHKNKGYDSSMDRSSNRQRRLFGQGQQTRTTLSHLIKNQRGVSEKVGFEERRDYTIKRPQLKVGSFAFIDTYSAF